MKINAKLHRITIKTLIRRMRKIRRNRDEARNLCLALSQATDKLLDERNALQESLAGINAKHDQELQAMHTRSRELIDEADKANNSVIELRDEVESLRHYESDHYKLRTHNGTLANELAESRKQVELLTQHREPHIPERVFELERILSHKDMQLTRVRAGNAAKDAIIDKFRERIEIAEKRLYDAGICPECGVELTHAIDEPFGGCPNCGDGEWTGEPPLIFKLRMQLAGRIPLSIIECKDRDGNVEALAIRDFIPYQIETSVSKCSACGGNHASMIFTALQEPCLDYTHSAPCPTNGVVVYLKREVTPPYIVTMGSEFGGRQADLDDEHHAMMNGPRCRPSDRHRENAKRAY